MKKILFTLTLLITMIGLIGCTPSDTVPTDDPVVIDTTYALLMDAEDLSGMADKTKTIIRVAGSLGLPTTYRGVTITYSSRNEDIISNSGVVTLPTECWIESRDQQGLSKAEFEGLNDNWPIVLDVVLSYQGQSRTAKLLFVVAPAEGFTCNKYLG
ncbi:MAG: hypothetical protein KKH92_08560 [Firmicutes bacterium]|nr:hypothetical protein [Bacillota bacterium]